MKIRTDDLTILGTYAVMHTFPHTECPGIESAFAGLVGLSVVRGYTTRSRRASAAPVAARTSNTWPGRSVPWSSRPSPRDGRWPSAGESPRTCLPAEAEPAVPKQTDHHHEGIVVASELDAEGNEGGRQCHGLPRLTTPHRQPHEHEVTQHQGKVNRPRFAEPAQARFFPMDPRIDQLVIADKTPNLRRPIVEQRAQAHVVGQGGALVLARVADEGRIRLRYHPRATTLTGSKKARPPAPPPRKSARSDDRAGDA